MSLEQRTLCHSCVQDYEEAGYYVKTDYSTKYRERCCMCGRMGWTYWIEKETLNKKHSRKH